MFKPYYGKCKCCGESGMIMTRSRGLRQQCELKRKKEKKKQETKKQNNGSELSESDVFRSIWVKQARVSFVTGKPLRDQTNARAWYFSHLLAKGKNKYPRFKYYEKNIVLMEFEEHQLWEYHKYRIKDDPQWKHVFELEQELKQEYKNLDQHGEYWII